ncbi:hypothetical protein COO60DRAFT_1701054 [Scenedesmus sp. NREL 46B-D3]|nr:hypothetical protein COO60DRAFT_1701054 [Scenedesmus sp. NREL 46B-D3]
MVQSSVGCGHWTAAAAGGGRQDCCFLLPASLRQAGELLRGEQGICVAVASGRTLAVPPVRLFKAKRAMRMVAVNPGQPDMLLTGELVSKDCTGSQLLQATPAHVQAAMRRSRRRAAATAAGRAGRRLAGQHGQGNWQQQQPVQQQWSYGPVGSNSSSGCAVGNLQQPLAGCTAGDTRTAGDMQETGHLAQQASQQQQQQQQQRLVAEQQQQQQQQQQIPGFSPTSTTLLQRIGASLWARGRSRSDSTSEAALAVVPATSAAFEPAATSAAGAEGASHAGALADSIHQLLAALRKVSAAATSAADEDGQTNCSLFTAQGRDRLLALAAQLQRHHLCSADEAAELCCLLRGIRRPGNALLQMPGFSCSWGLDAAGCDAQLRLCGGPAGSFVVRQLAEVLTLPASESVVQASHSWQQTQQAAEEADMPCFAVLRIWRLHAQQQDGGGAPQPLGAEQQLLVVPFVVLCSERSVGVSPCGRVLVAMVAVRPASSGSSSRAAENLGQLDPSTWESDQAVEYELRVISLEAGSMGQVLAARSMAAADCLTCVQVSPTGQHVLLAYGRRSKQLNCLVAGQGSFEVWHTALQVYRMSDLTLVRQMISRDDEVNVAAWHPCPGRGIAYGTKSGRVRIIAAGGGGDSCHSCAEARGGAAAEATSVLQQALQ